MAVPNISSTDGGGFRGCGVVTAPFSAYVLPKPTEESTNVVKAEKENLSSVLDAIPDSATCGVSASDGCGSSTEIQEVEETMKVVPIKVEEEEEEDTGAIDGRYGCDAVANNNGSPSSSSSVVLPKPMEGLNELGPPPFLKKTFEMVEDPETYSIVSWSKNLDSFIVWDSHEFSKNLLPKYFKHSNFSSFIRQLNTYGFRKIDPDRWEFANEGFQGGKKHLLKNIKRRSRYNKQHQEVMSSTDSSKLGLEIELDNLKNDQDILRVEVLKLRQQQEDSQNQLNAVAERIRAAEHQQLQMFIFFSKAAKNPGFIQQLIQKRKQQGELDAGGELGKKRRLLPTQVLESLPDAVDTGQSVNCRNQAQEKLAAMQTELTEILPDVMQTSPMSKLFAAPMNEEFGNPIQDHKANVMCETVTQDMSSVYHLMSEKLLDGNSLVESSVDKDLDVNDSKFYLELEDLIRKPRAWGGYVTGLVGHTGCIG